MAWLIGMDGEHRGRQVLLDSSCLIGRGPYNHLILEDRRISRQHARISAVGGAFELLDLHSVNGTYVNGAAISRRKLQPTDTLRFGPFTFRFEVDPAAIARPQTDTGDTGPLPSPAEESLSGRVRIMSSLDAASAADNGLAELRDAQRKLRTLQTLMHSVSAVLEVGELVERLAADLLLVFPTARMTAVYLRDPFTGAPVPRAVRPQGSDWASLHALADRFQREVMQRGQSILAAPDAGGATPTGGFSMHAPLLCRDSIAGALHVVGDRPSPGGHGSHLGRGGFSRDDLDLLTSAATQAAMALDNVRMHQDTLKRQRLEQDLRVAERIQKSFLPPHLPTVPGFDLAVEYRPHYQIGGDFYDVFQRGDGKLALLIGDVSGKGVSAALIMARVSSDLRIAALADEDPARVLERVNRATMERQQHEIFITGIYLTLDVATRRVRFANAGHPPPLLRRRGGAVERIDRPASTALGIMESPGFESGELTLQPGDALVLCTDGVLEAPGKDDRHFHLEGVAASLAAAGDQVPEIKARLLSDVAAHLGQRPPADDLTIVVIGARA